MKDDNHLWMDNVCSICGKVSENIEGLLRKKIEEKGFSINLITIRVKYEAAKIFSAFGSFEVEYISEEGHNEPVTEYFEDPNYGMNNINYSGWYPTGEYTWVVDQPAHLRINPPLIQE